MNKKLMLLTFFTPIITLIIFCIYFYCQTLGMMDIKIRIKGYDPRDLLAGHYIQYTIDWDNTDCSQFEDKICPKTQFCSPDTPQNNCRFYIPEAYAYKLDRLMRNNDTTHVFEIIYAYSKDKTPLPKELLIDTKNWRNAIN